MAGSLCGRTARAEGQPAPAPAAPVEGAANGAVPMTSGERDRTTEVAGLLDTLARDALARGEHEPARLSLAKVLELQVALFGENDARVGATLTRLAQCHERLDHPSLASLLYGRALALNRASAAPDHELAGLQLHGLGKAHARLHRVVEAETFYREALAAREKILGSGHPGVAEVLLDLARLYRDSARPYEAEPLYRRALALQEQAARATAWPERLQP